MTGSKGSWTAAKNEAIDAGGHLVAIAAAEENEWLLEVFGEGDANLWIGFTDEDNEGEWVWSNGEDVTYENWAPGEPNNNGNEDYAFIFGNGTYWPGQWNDHNESDIMLYGIIERTTLPSDWVYNAHTGNFYRLPPSKVSWTAAENKAIDAGGHLVAIGDAEENQWLLEVFGDDDANLWIGFTDENNEGEWIWSNGEDVTYENWAPGEPNNNGDEDYAFIFGNGTYSPGQWNDHNQSDIMLYGIIERTTPFDWVYNLQTGNVYTLSGARGSWTAAENEAIDAGGHLVAIGGADENQWLLEVFGNADENLWIGLTDEDNEGEWIWSNGEDVTYENWAPGEPNNNGDEDYAFMFGNGTYWPGQWNDHNQSPPFELYGIIERLHCSGDADDDGDTDQSDLGILLALWGSCEGDSDFIPEADLDRDGCVGQPDLGILLADWGCGNWN